MSKGYQPTGDAKAPAVVHDQNTSVQPPTPVASLDPEVKEARAVQTLVESLASFVTVEDLGMSRMDFLRTVASRILDDIDP